MKMYNTLQTAFNLSMAENGDPESWAIDDSDKQGSFDKYFGKYLKIANYCSDDASSCGIGNNLEFKYLNFDGDEEEVEGGTSVNYKNFLENEDVAAILNDGAIIMPRLFSEIIADTNGAKGPNVAGRDIFIFTIENIQDKWSIYPQGLIKYDPEIGFRTLTEIEESDNPDENCTTSGTSLGMACGARLLLKGKMDY